MLVSIPIPSLLFTNFKEISIKYQKTIFQTWPSEVVYTNCVIIRKHVTFIIQSN
jgi:hypothetical protein